jgi:hypothetical protein
VVRAANGDALASRRATVSFRTFATAPYASLAGSVDDTLDAIEDGGVSDDGGSASPSGSTLVRVQYQQQGTPNRIPADVWRSQEQHPATASPPWDN